MAEAAGAFVTRAFERMLAETSTRKHANLHKALKAYLERSKNPQGLSRPKASTGHYEDEEVVAGSNQAPEDKSRPGSPVSPTLPNVGEAGSIASASAAATLGTARNTLSQSEAELVLLPLRLAFETKQPKIVDTALDCLHKIISYDHLEGDAGLEGGKNASMVTDIFNMVCTAADSNAPDSTSLQVLKVLLIAIMSLKFKVHEECLLSAIRTCYHIVISSKNLINQATAKATLTQMVNIIFKRMELESEHQGDMPTSGVILDENVICNTTREGEATASEKIASSSEQGLPEKVLASEVATVSVEELQHLAGDADIEGLEAALTKAKTVHLDGAKKLSEGLDLESMTVTQRDGLMVFRMLCKMSMEEEKDDVITRTRILSFELLLGLLESVSHSFSIDLRFIDSVKAYLCYALLRACVSPVGAIFQLATSIFSVLLLRFRESLKAEIGVLFPLIVLRPLDNSDSVAQCTTLLKMLETICKDSQMLADVFANYDCDLESTNLFERMIQALSRTAKGSSNADPTSTTFTQSSFIKASSLQCLVSILSSVLQWTKQQRNRSKAGMNTSNLCDETQAENNSGEDAIEQHDSFEKAKAHKSILEAAITEFNRKPEKGIDYLVSNKLVDYAPKSIAAFLLSTPGLDKSIIGEYLGQHEEFPLAVMHAYVDAMTFKAMKFDVAIREFLKGFRLPGEAQKIDRLMEKFAERYCCDNPGIFDSADAAYVLAYAVIMLNTDAHNPMVWPKMTKADFIRINTGSQLDKGAVRELLEDIYDSIVKDEIKMKDESPLGGKESTHKQDTEEKSRLVSILNLGWPHRKSSLDAKKESTDFVKLTQALFKKGVLKRGIFYTAKQVELVKPMLEAMGWPLLAAFSVTMEDSDSRSQVVPCMQGFRAGIELTKILGMDTMRYAFLTSLVRFTFLHAPKEMRGKNVEALRTLLLLGDAEPDALQDTWNAVLECVSRLEYIVSSPSILQTVMAGSNQISRDALAQSLIELAGKPLEQIFVNTVKLPSDAIVEFFTGLCGVSVEELKQTPPRVFSLQKLVEVSYYNMSRIRMVWARIWLVLSHHIVTAGSHHDEQIAMYAIDSLRQLGIKYLERAELANFTFQNDILKPFVILIRNNHNPSIRALIVACVVQMIKSKVASIKSGWQCVFMVFKAAASDDQASITESAFENMEQVVLEHFDQVVGDCFMDCVHCLIAFANNKSCPRISLKAIALLRICEDRLAEGLIPGGASKPIEIDDSVDGFDVAEHYWFPMLVGLSELTSDSRTEIRSCALEVLFDVLSERGSKFSASFWENIFHDVLFPIFDHLRNEEMDGEKSAPGDVWLQETCIHSLQLLCNLFSAFYKEVSFMLPSLLGLLLDCATRQDQTLAYISIDALTHLMQVGGHHFDEKDWNMVLESLRDACYSTQPVELFNSTNITSYNSKAKFLGPMSDDMALRWNYSEGRSSGAMFDPIDDNASATVQSLINGSVSNGYEGLEPQQIQDSNEGEGALDGKGPTKDISRNQTLGRALMDTILLKNLTFKGKGTSADGAAVTLTEEVIDTGDSSLGDGVDDEMVVAASVRSKCMTQLLFLGTIDSLQEKHWLCLHANHKILIMEILLSMVDFAASYNSYKNVQARIRLVPGSRTPPNILRQEIEATRIYLSILNKALQEYRGAFEKETLCNGSVRDVSEASEEHIVSFCFHILDEVSSLQPGIGEVLELEAYQAVMLRSPVVIKVLNQMSNMVPDVFKQHLGQFYPCFTKLICSDQVQVRRALGDLFQAQLVSILP